MSHISLTTYSDISALRKSFEALHEGLHSQHIIVAHPQDNTIEIRVATLWEKFCSLIRFKPVNIRLATIQPLIFKFFKNNETLLASDPTLYPKLLKIYLSTVYPQEKQAPLCLQKTSRAFREKPITLTLNEPSLTVSIISQTKPEKVYLLSCDPYNHQRKIITIPYQLLANGPSDCLKALDSIKTHSFTPPSGLYLDTKTLFLVAWEKYCEFDTDSTYKNALEQFMKCIDSRKFDAMQGLLDESLSEGKDAISTQNEQVIDFKKLISLINQLKELNLFDVISQEDLPYLQNQLSETNSPDYSDYIISQKLTHKKITVADFEKATFSAEIWEIFVNYFIQGHLPNQLPSIQLIDIAKLAATFKHERLARKAFCLAINSFDQGNQDTSFIDLVELMLDEMLPYAEAADQQLAFQLITKAQKLTDVIQQSLLEFLKTQAQDEKSPWLARYLLAKCYEYGIGTKQDFEEAIKLYTDLSNQNNSWAQLEIGKWHQYFGADLQQALSWYTESANQGVISALYHKAVLLVHGEKNQKDETQALAILEQLANEGEGLGLYGLATFYINGTVVVKNIPKALKLYHLAADKQEPRALHQLALMYEEGLVVQKNLEKAFEFYLCAAEQGFMPSQKKVSECYEKGIGTNQNLNEAKQWITKYNQQQQTETQAKQKLLTLLTRLDTRASTQTTTSS